MNIYSLNKDGLIRLSSSNSKNIGNKFLAIGDSYTIGEAVEIKDRWPVQLVTKLEESGIIISDLKIVATTGWTTSELITNIKEEIFEPPYDLVSLLIGVNNQYRGEDTKIYRKELTELIYQAIDFTGGDKSKVIVLSIPDWSDVPFAEGRDRKKIAFEIDMFNQIKLEQCNSLDVKFLNITPISRKVSEDSFLTAGDGLHPSGKMYSMWVDLIYPHVKYVLSGESN